MTQLVLGSYMVWDARRKSLSDNYFAGDGPACPVAAGGGDGA